MSSELILVVCAANVCRSPMAEFLLRRGLEGVSEVHVASAGTQAQGGGKVCPLVAEWNDDEAWRVRADAHRSRRVDSDLLGAAALVLVSSRDVRADVVLAAPEVRGRTYTLREAAHLGVDFDSTLLTRRVGVITRYAMHLDRARVVRGALPDVRRRWWRAPGTDGPDIVDGHGVSRHAHQAALKVVLGATTAVVRQLGGHLA